MLHVSVHGQAFKSNNGLLLSNSANEKPIKNETKADLKTQVKIDDLKTFHSLAPGRSASECPESSLYSNPLAGYLNASNAEFADGYAVATSYFVDGSIDSLIFWGVNAYFDGTSWISCTNDNPALFDVEFYENGQDTIGDSYKSYIDIAATPIGTGEEFMTGFEIVQFTIVLSSSCDLNMGYVSLTAKSDNSCAFLWIDSPNGSGNAYQYDYTSTTWTEQLIPYTLCVVGKPNACLAPVDLSAFNISTSSADLGWTELNEASKWQVNFSNVTTSQVTSTLIDVTENPYTLEQLSIQSQYEYSARAVCAEGDTSIWSPAYSFRTPCDVVTEFPFVENFDGDWTSWCWTIINADNDDYTWNQSDTYITPVMSGDYAAHGMGNQDDYLITPALALDAEYQFSWYDKVESSSNNNTYEILVSTTGMQPENFTDNLGTFDCMNTDWEKHTVYLTDYAGQTIYIAIHQTYSAASYWGFGIEDVSIDLKPDCVPVTDLSVSNITTTSAVLSWVENGDATSWNMEYGHAGFTPGDGSSIMVTALPYTLTDLTEGTAFEFYVQADCGSSSSDWVGPMAFSTACLTSTVLDEGFEAGVPPICWITFANGAGSAVWTEGTDAYQGDYAAKAAFESSTGENEKWLVTGKTTIPAGKSLSFYTMDYFTSDYGSSLSIMVSTADYAEDVDSYTEVYTLYETDVTNEAFTAMSVDLSTYEGQDAFIAFVMTDNDGDTWYLDNVSFVSCVAPTDLVAANITTTSADISWTGDADAYTLQYGLSGFGEGEGTTAELTEASYALTDLEPSTSYDVYVKSVCGVDDESAWAGPLTFNTANIPCGNITEFPYTQGFEGQDDFDCWTPMYNTADDGGLDGTNLVAPGDNSWFIITPESFSGEGAYYIYEGTRAAGLGYTAPDFNWLISPNIELPEGGGDLNFMLWLKDSTEVSWITKFYVTVFDGTVWNTALTFDGTGADNEYESLVTVDLAAYAAQTIQVAFVFEYNDGYELAIDNISITTKQSSEAAITAFSFAEQVGDATIDTDNHSIAIDVENTDATALVATFTLSDGAEAKIGDVVQESGVTTNDFTSPVTYTVIAENGTSVDWTVNVTTTGVADNLQNSVRIYPNPNNGSFTIEGEFAEKAYANVLDLSGKIITTVEITNAIQAVSLHNFENGIYFLEIVSGSNKATYKVFKQ
jgi:hypothetical protein